MFLKLKQTLAEDALQVGIATGRQTLILVLFPFLALAFLIV